MGRVLGADDGFSTSFRTVPASVVSPYALRCQRVATLAVFIHSVCYVRDEVGCTEAMLPNNAPTRAINKKPTNAPNHFPAVDPKSLSNPDTGHRGSGSSPRCNAPLPRRNSHTMYRKPTKPVCHRDCERVSLPSLSNRIPF